METPPIIVIKKRAAHAGHHGGAWKVAYADFVTAMMALFIVLWLMNSSQKVKEGVAGYFNDPMGRPELPGANHTKDPKIIVVPPIHQSMEQLKQQIEKRISEQRGFDALKKQIEITVTPEGLRIELLEARDGTFFESGSATLNEKGDKLLALLAHELGKVSNRIQIEGHTDAYQFADDSSYGNWELSADRANAARRLMQHTGIRLDQISQVRGYADQHLRVPGNPLDPSNRRITIIVPAETVLPAALKAAVITPVATPQAKGVS